MNLLNAKQTQWSRRYQDALGKHIQQPRGARMAPALALGRQAVALGLETLDVAGIHESSMIALAANAAPRKAVAINRAQKFFLEVLVPIEATHAPVLETERLVQTATEALRLRTKESSAATRRLARGVAKRKAAESVLAEGGRELARLEQASRRLQARLLQNTRTRILTQEDARRDISRQLQNEIGQTLLAIHLRLLTLKLSTQASMERLKTEVVANQALVKESSRTIQRLTHEIDHYYGA